MGVFFVTQSPLDVPEEILGQLGARIQHALRAFTPRDRKAVKTVAQTFRENPELDTEQVITELGTGEALVSVLNGKGAPTPVERILIRPPASRIGPLTAQERNEILSRSPLKGKYDQEIDRESAYEMLKQKAEAEARMEAAARAAAEQARARQPARRRGGSRRQSVWEAMAKSVARSVGSSLGRRIARGVLDTLLGGCR